MNLFKCAVCNEESWFQDGTDGHCLRCAVSAPGRLIRIPKAGFNMEPDRLSPLPDNSHYKQGSIDPLQYVEAIGDAEYVGACILNVVKYVTRYRFKGSALDDLAKAKDYVDKLIEHQKKKEAK